MTKSQNGAWYLGFRGHHSGAGGISVAPVSAVPNKPRAFAKSSKLCNPNISRSSGEVVIFNKYDSFATKMKTSQPNFRSGLINFLVNDQV